MELRRFIVTFVTSLPCLLTFWYAIYIFLFLVMFFVLVFCIFTESEGLAHVHAIYDRVK